MKPLSGFADLANQTVRVLIPGQDFATRQNLAHRTINLSMGRLNQDATRTHLRRMEQPTRLNYHFGHR